MYGLVHSLCACVCVSECVHKSIHAVNLFSFQSSFIYNSNHITRGKARLWCTIYNTQMYTNTLRISCGKKVKYQERGSAKVKCLNSMNSRPDRQHTHIFCYVWMAWSILWSDCIKVNKTISKQKCHSLFLKVKVLKFFQSLLHTQTVMK